jgi:hypothetical protein
MVETAGVSYPELTLSDLSKRIRKNLAQKNVFRLTGFLNLSRTLLKICLVNIRFGVHIRMERPNPQEMLLRSAEAHDLIENEPDPGIKILLKPAQWRVIQTFMRRSDTQSDEEFLDQLPLEPFDMLFYITAVKKLLSYKHMVSQVLFGNLDAAEDVW